MAVHKHPQKGCFYFAWRLPTQLELILTKKVNGIKIKGVVWQTYTLYRYECCELIPARQASDRVPAEILIDQLGTSFVLEI